MPQIGDIHQNPSGAPEQIGSAALEAAMIVASRVFGLPVGEAQDAIRVVVLVTLHEHMPPELGNAAVCFSGYYEGENGYGDAQLLEDTLYHARAMARATGKDLWVGNAPGFGGQG